MMMRTMKSGRTTMNKTFADMFNKQAENQREMINAGTYDGVADVEYGCE